MKRAWNAHAIAILFSMCLAVPALGQKPGGVLRVTHPDSPASMSIHEEGTYSVIVPMMGVFNNLVMYDQHKPQAGLSTIVPELATNWAWDEDGTGLTFTLRKDVKWHDGKPFTAADVKCTWDVLSGRGGEKLRINFREAWYENLAEVTTAGDHEVTFRLKRRQPAFIAMLASGYSPVYPCHVPLKDMRQKPVGTGPFKFVEYKPNQGIKLTRNPDYWKPGQPYLDGIEYTIIPNRSTAMLSFIAGQFDMTFPYEVTVPLMKDVASQAPQAVCQMRPVNVRVYLLVNHTVAPFDKLEMRQAMALALDRKSFIDILDEGQGEVGGVMLPQPEGSWGMPAEMLKTLADYTPDLRGRRALARELMKKLGYGPDKHLKVVVSTRNLPRYRDPAAILMDQLKDIWIDGELETIETANWTPKLLRKDYTVSLALSGSALDDPDPQYFENYMCGTSRNYTGSCDPELDRMIVEQSTVSDQEARKQIVWKIERRLIEQAVRPIIYFRRAATCWHPHFKGLTVMANGPYNGWRLEDVWLER